MRPGRPARSEAGRRRQGRKTGESGALAAPIGKEDWLSSLVAVEPPLAKVSFCKSAHARHTLGTSRFGVRAAQRRRSSRETAAYAALLVPRRSAPADLPRG